MSVNKLLTFIKHNCDRRKEDNSFIMELPSASNHEELRRKHIAGEIS